MNKNYLWEQLDKEKDEVIKKTKRGVAFIITSIILWVLILIIGINFKSIVLILAMIGLNLIFLIWLTIENKSIKCHNF